MLLDIKHISYSLQWKNLIKDLSFSIEENTVISIIGYNGSWKSTLLKLLLWSIEPDAWTIIRSPDLNVGYVPQKLWFDHQLPLTVRDFIQIYNTDTKQKSSFSCSILNIKPILDIPLSWLSGWQLQKVLIYNALLGEPKILFLDEPTAGLDVLAQKEFYTLIEHVHQAHKVSIVLVSHDIHTVYSKSDSIICLHKGSCCTWSPKDKEFSQEVSTLLGWYVMPYVHSHDSSHNQIPSW